MRTHLPDGREAQDVSRDGQHSDDHEQDKPLSGYLFQGRDQSEVLGKAKGLLLNVPEPSGEASRK